jgi:membrane glycosyltransferase
MTGESILKLTSMMECDPDAGIIQSLPLIINRNTLFARLQQFAARVYGPVIAAGLSAWMGRDGNYWGHNAIIRTRAFAEQGGMPTLPGKPPFGGHILSHDFVEAALLRRAGWAVYMLPTLEGSYEESPPSLIDLSVRDRRWCQGNLQHVAVIGAKGLKWPTRQHFATGIMSYAASPLWLMQLTVGLILVLQTKYVRPEYFTEEFSLFPTWPRFDPERALQLFIFTIGILIAPKIFGLFVVLTNRSIRRGCGGAIRTILSTSVEIIGSALIAPVAMLIQSGAVFQILAGRDTGWNPQRRGDGSIPFSDIVRRHRLHTLLGLVAGAAAYALSPFLFAWMSPTIVGLVLAIPISAASGHLMLGLALKRVGLLLTPEETDPPQIAIRANILRDELASLGFDDTDSLAAIHAEPKLREAHIAMLPEVERRLRGQIDPARAIAEAKLTDAQSINEAIQWLEAPERKIVLSDRALIAVLASLSDRPFSEAANAA